MGGEVDQGDLLAAALGDLHPSGQIFGDGIVELHFAALDHVGEQERGEHLGHRADLEDRPLVHRPAVGLVRDAVAHEPPAMGVDDAHHDADALMLRIDAVGQDPADLSVGRDHPGLGRRCGRRRLRADGGGGAERQRASEADGGRDVPDH